jgi:hypothetical protein
MIDNNLFFFLVLQEYQSSHHLLRSSVLVRSSGCIAKKEHIFYTFLKTRKSIWTRHHLGRNMMMDVAKSDTDILV